MNGTTNPIDLSREGVERIIAALTTAGIEVHYHETDEHYVDLHLTPVDADPHTVLSWYQQEGWVLFDRDEDGDPLGRWLFGHVDLAVAVTAAKSLLDDDTEGGPAPLPALTGPLVAAGWTLDAVTEMADASVDHLYLHPSGREISARVVDGQDVRLTLTGLTLDQATGAVVGAGLAPELPYTTPHRVGDTRFHIGNDGLVYVDASDEPCSRCTTTPARPGVCCSSHERRVCHLCYRRTHLVEVCVAGCSDCAAEGLPVRLADLTAQDGAR